MSVELNLLIWSAGLVFAYVLVQSTAYRLDYGLWHAGSQRDNERPPNKWAARGNRVLRNFLETYGAFIALAVATELSGRSDAMTQWGAQIWFWARAAYLPAYFIDIPLMRSGFWLVSLAGLVMMFIGVVS
jgi:uncharacterized MAPEG superfamily protein